MKKPITLTLTTVAVAALVTTAYFVGQHTAPNVTSTATVSKSAINAPVKSSTDTAVSVADTKAIAISVAEKQQATHKDELAKHAEVGKTHDKTAHHQPHSTTTQHSQSAKSFEKNTTNDMMLAKTPASTKNVGGTLINERKILKNAPSLDPKALDYAVNGYSWALRKGHVRNPGVLTIIDFNKPSSSKRMWVIDLRNNRVLMNLYTTHGKNSGMDVANRFSARVGSDMTSLGVYETLNPYNGGHGLSLKLQGLERGINDTAYRRTVVVHPAWYATPSYIRQNHRAGRSWGCFAIDPGVSKKLINTIENGSIIFAYANQEKNDPVVA